MYTYEVEITPNYCYFALISTSLMTTVFFYIDQSDYAFSPDIVTFADDLLTELGFIPGKIEE